MKPTVRRRKRVKHFQNPGHSHFLTFSCNRRLHLLTNDRLRWALVEAIQRSRARHSFALWAWVFMTNHVHLLIHPRKDEYSICSILSSIKRPVAARELRRLRMEQSPLLKTLFVPSRGEARFWLPGPGFDENLETPIGIHRVVQYIHLNPVKWRFVASPADWRWSSACEWLEGRRSPLPVDKTWPPVDDDPHGQIWH